MDRLKVFGHRKGIKKPLGVSYGSLILVKLDFSPKAKFDSLELVNHVFDSEEASLHGKQANAWYTTSPQLTIAEISEE